MKRKMFLDQSIAAGEDEVANAVRKELWELRYGEPSAVSYTHLRQETKCQQGQVKLELPGHYQYWNYANRRGYSGTAVFTKKEPLSVAYGIGIEEHDKEGRVITLEMCIRDRVKVICLGKDKMGRISFSMKDVPEEA